MPPCVHRLPRAWPSPGSTRGNLQAEARSREGTGKARAPKQLCPVGPTSFKVWDHSCGSSAVLRHHRVQPYGEASIRLSFSHNPEFLQREFPPCPGAAWWQWHHSARPPSQAGPSALVSCTGDLQQSDRMTKQLPNSSTKETLPIPPTKTTAPSGHTPPRTLPRP